MFKQFEMELAGRTLRVDVGRVAKQANGAVLIKSLLLRQQFPQCWDTETL